MNSGCATTGFTGQENATLLPDLDQNGDILYPDTKYEVGMLCDICKVVMSKAELIFDQYGRGGISRETAIVPFYTTKAEIGISAGSGCHLCSIFLLKEKTKRSNSSPSNSIPNGLTSWVALDKDSPRIKMRQLRNDALNNPQVTAYLWPSSPYTLDYTELLSASNASEATFRSASAWLVSCLKEHRHEPAGLQPLQSPKRLLYLGDQLDRRLRVVYPTTPISYLTVSHCWGGKVNRTLNAETYSELTTGIEDAWLPRLWRDCVTVTRRLGYAYLWIDSLCIQQDNANDKAQEIMKMGDIYSGSVCNIAAVSAPDSSVSLFTKYVRLGIMDLHMSPRVPKKSPGCEQRVSFMGEDPSSPTPLYERAWVVQERILAPRTLEYTWQGVRHCCSSTILEESIYDPCLDSSAQWAELLKCDKEQMSDLDKRETLDLWMGIVCQYTRAALTMETDRKIALNGIIGVLSQLTGLSFCSGVCKDLAPYSLLWRMDEPRDLTCQPSYTDPSWSCTFRPAEVSDVSLEGECEDLNGIDCSFDELRSIVSFNARCSGERTIKADPGPLQINSREKIELQNLDGIWTDYRKHELFDKRYHDVVNIYISPDYNGFDPVEVEFALLSYSPMTAFGLVLTKIPDAGSLWKRLGMFELELYETEAFKVIQDPLAFMLAPWQKTAEFQVC